MKVLVVGKNGQLAQSLAYVQKSFNLDLVFYAKENLDVRDVTQINKAITAENPDVVINCAGYTNVTNAETEQGRALAFDVNVNGVNNLVECCNTKKVKILHISTDYVFDGEKNSPYLEADLTNPLNYYGATKNQADKFVLSNSNEFVIVRASWLFSPFGHNFVKTITNKLLGDEDVKVINSEVGSPTSSLCLARFILSIIEKDIFNNEIINFANSDVGTWFDLANEISSYLNNLKITKQSSTVKAIDTFDSDVFIKRPKYSVLDLQRLQELGFHKPENWIEALQETLSILLSNKQ